MVSPRCFYAMGATGIGGRVDVHNSGIYNEQKEVEMKSASISLTITSFSGLIQSNTGILLALHSLR